MNVSAVVRESDGKIYVDGSFVDATGGMTVEILEKATGTVLGVAAVATEDDVAASVVAARRAQAGWAGASIDDKAWLLRRVADLLEQRSDEIVDLLIRETGSIRGKAMYEVQASVSYLHDAAALARHACGEIIPTSVPGKTNLVRRVPVGVVGVITPWNFPLVLALYTTAPALALGNAVVLKPAPNTPITGGQMIAELFAAAGVPPGVFNVVTGDGPSTGEALVRHPEVDMIHFTGSTSTGRRIGELAGRALKRVSMEMGGNNAFVVLDDADVEIASSVGAWSSFFYQGQTCISASRHIVARSIANDYVERLAERARLISVGDPAVDEVGLGPMISTGQRDRALDLLESSVRLGASIVEGGEVDGPFFRPTVVAGVAPGMPLFDEEVFAPVAPVTVVDSEDEALVMTNATTYGLVNSVFTEDVARGLAFAERVTSGMVHVNDTTCLVETNVPFGGIGCSGVGSPTGGSANIEQFTERQWISVQPSPGVSPF